MLCHSVQNRHTATHKFLINTLHSIQGGLTHVKINKSINSKNEPFALMILNWNSDKSTMTGKKVLVFVCHNPHTLTLLSDDRFAKGLICSYTVAMHSHPLCLSSLLALLFVCPWLCKRGCWELKSGFLNIEILNLIMGMCFIICANKGPSHPPSNLLLTIISL